MAETDRVFCGCCALTQLSWSADEPEPTACFLCHAHKPGSKAALVEHEGRLLERMKRLELAVRDYAQELSAAREELLLIADLHTECTCLQPRPCETNRLAAAAATVAATAIADVPGMRPL
ncbi:MAG TPA: hypothetical protein VNA14_03915 [Mycobacteriales bacterium]|nr:hypothetical protein [Mycobacteriales bacterium]